MKLRQVQFAVAIARTGSFSQAARICGATQPTLSNAVRQLEEELGGKLFTRTTRTVRLTPFGRHMAPHLEAVLTARDEAASAAEAFRDPQQKLLRIGLSPLVDMAMVMAVTGPFAASHDGIEIFYKECLLDDLAVRLETGAIDIAVLPRHIVPDELDRLEFYSDPLFYLPRHGAENASAATIRVADLPRDPVIMTGGGCGLNDTVAALFEDEGADLQVYPGYATGYPVIEEWAWMGIGAGVLPRAKLTGHKGAPHCMVHSDGHPARLDLFWTWRREACARPHVAKFVQFVRHKGPSIITGQARQAAV